MISSETAFEKLAWEKHEFEEQEFEEHEFEKHEFEEQEFEKLSLRVSTYFEQYNVLFVKDYMQSNGFAKEIQQKADHLCAHTFTFEEPWDMEPCSTPYTLADLRWDVSPNGDPEWVFMLNRHEMFHSLWRAARATGNLEYANKLKEFMFHWIEHNPICEEGGDTIRTIDTGIRLMVWGEALYHLLDLGVVNSDETKQLLTSMQEQMQYLKRKYIGKYTLSNWGFLQTTAICGIYIRFPEFFKDQALFEWAKKELCQQLLQQVYDSGVHWEQSIMYHMEVLNAGMKLLLLMSTIGACEEDEFAAQLEPILKKMAYYVLYATGPDGNQQAQGDSDITNTGDVLTKAAVLWNDGTLKSGGFEKMDADTVFWFGKSGVNRYEKLLSMTPENRDFYCFESGNFYFRNQFNKEGSLVYLHNGSLGSSHGHMDLTHVSFLYHGEPFLVDCGRYTYVEGDSNRTYLKSVYAHNGVVLDETPYGNPIQSWSYDGFGKPLRSYVVQKQNVHYAELPYCFKTSNKDVFHVLRKVMFLDEGILIICDEMLGNQFCHMKKRYHLDCRVKVDAMLTIDDMVNVDVTVKIDDTAKNNGCKERTIVNLRQKEANLIYETTGNVKICETVQSNRYNELQQSQCVEKQRIAKDYEMADVDIFHGVEFKIVPAKIFQCGAEAVVGEETVSAFEIWKEGTINYVVVLFHKEIYSGAKLFYYKEIPLYGRSIVLKHTEEGFTAIRM